MQETIGTLPEIVQEMNNKNKELNKICIEDLIADSSTTRVNDNCVPSWKEEK